VFVPCTVEISGNRLHHFEKVFVITLLHDFCAFTTYPVGLAMESWDIG
jgi:hypothetical protein